MAFGVYRIFRFIRVPRSNISVSLALKILADVCGPILWPSQLQRPTLRYPLVENIVVHPRRRQQPDSVGRYPAYQALLQFLPLFMTTGSRFGYTFYDFF